MKSLYIEQVSATASPITKGTRDAGVSHIDTSNPCAKESNYVVDDIRIKAVLK